MKNLAAILLAAGKGTRMKSKTLKVLHTVAGLPMLFYPLKVLEEVKAGRVVVVVGFGGDRVRAEVAAGKKVLFVDQTEQLGTGHAVMTAQKALKGFSGDVLILSEDVPLISASTVKALVKMHRRGGKNRPTITMVTTVVSSVMSTMVFVFA